MDLARDERLSSTASGDLQSLLEQVMEKAGVPGISAALLRDGKVISSAVGLRTTTTPAPMTVESRFALGSMGKFLTGVAAAESLTSGALNRAAPLRNYIPELADCDMGNEVAVWHLMSHTTGCYQDESGVFEDSLGLGAEWDRFARHFTAARRLFAPGSVFSYEGSNYVLVGEILRRLHGVATRDLIRTRVLDPLGIDADGADSDQENPGRYVENHREKAARVFEPCAPLVTSQLWDASLSGLTLSMPDLVAIAASIIDAPVKRRSLIEQVVQVPFAPEWHNKDCATSSYGMGCMGYANGSLGHSGVAAGQCCALHFDPVRKTAFAVGINAPTLRSRDATLSALMRSAGYSTEGTTSPLTAGSFDPRELVGDYVGGSHGRVLEVRAEGAGLVCQLGTRSSAAATPGPRFPIIRFRVTDAGEVTLEEASRPIPMCFFHEPGSGTPCLLAGARAYRRCETK